MRTLRAPPVTVIFKLQIEQENQSYLDQKVRVTLIMATYELINPRTKERTNKKRSWRVCNGHFVWDDPNLYKDVVFTFGYTKFKNDDLKCVSLVLANKSD